MGLYDSDTLLSSFVYCLLFSFLVGALVGGIFAQERVKARDNVRVAKAMFMFGVLSLPFGVFWGWSYLSASYRLECSSDEFLIWQNLQNAPTRIPIKEMTDVRLGMTSSKGDRWEVLLYFGDDDNFFSTTTMNIKNAKLLIDKIQKVKSEGCTAAAE